MRRGLAHLLVVACPQDALSWLNDANFPRRGSLGFAPMGRERRKPMSRAELRTLRCDWPCGQPAQFLL